jgi:hypothetical protein
MKSLLIQVGINLEDYRIPEYIRPNGPYFHRWLPNGEEDAIQLETGDSNSNLRVWFKRRGVIKNGFVEYDSKM